MDEERRAFYEYHAALMEPWDGPAAIAFTDGQADRARRSTATACGRRAISSPMTASSCSPPRWACCRSRRSKIVEKWRLQPGRMLLIDLEQGRIVSDDEIKHELAPRQPL